VFVKRSKPRGVRVVRSEELAAGLSQPRWMSESPRVSTRDRRSCLTFVSLPSAEMSRLSGVTRSEIYKILQRGAEEPEP
jgi:hypothetical protein